MINDPAGAAIFRDLGQPGHRPAGLGRVVVPGGHLPPSSLRKLK
jgi:hypothetical protein